MDAEVVQIGVLLPQVHLDGGNVLFFCLHAHPNGFAEQAGGTFPVGEILVVFGSTFIEGAIFKGVGSPCGCVFRSGGQSFPAGGEGLPRHTVDVLVAVSQGHGVRLLLGGDVGVNLQFVQENERSPDANTHTDADIAVIRYLLQLKSCGADGEEAGLFKFHRAQTVEGFAVVGAVKTGAVRQLYPVLGLVQTAGDDGGDPLAVLSQVHGEDQVGGKAHHTGVDVMGAHVGSLQPVGELLVKEVVVTAAGGLHVQGVGLAHADQGVKPFPVFGLLLGGGVLCGGFPGGGYGFRHPGLTGGKQKHCRQQQQKPIVHAFHKGVHPFSVLNNSIP